MALILKAQLVVISLSPLGSNHQTLWSSHLVAQNQLP